MADCPVNTPPMDCRGSALIVSRKRLIHRALLICPVFLSYRVFLLCLVLLTFLALLPLWPNPIGCHSAYAATYIVAESGGDFTSVQAGLDAATPGDTVLVREKPTPYFEKIHFPSSGNPPDAYVTLMAYPGEHPILDGTGVPNNPASYTDDMVYLENKSYIRIAGFEIRNVDTGEGSGVRVYGHGSHIEIRDNEIHEIRGGGKNGGAMGITIYGSDDSLSLSNIVIDGNHIHDCDPAYSEALTLNGNVEQFEVTNNIVENVNNIGIDFIGGEDWLSTRYARDGICAWNQVYNANSPYGGGWAGGIYVDGGQNITIENNIVSGCDLGIEIGAENSDVIVTGVIVRNNVVYENDKVGIVFGGYASNTGRVMDCKFLNNTCYGNDVLGEGLGELWIQYAENNEIKNNIFYSNAQNVLLSSWAGNVNNILDHNLWYTDAGAGSATFIWNSTAYYTFSSYRTGTGQDSNSIFDDPEFLNPGAADFHIGTSSPAVDLGDPAFASDSLEVDIDSEPRLSGPRVDAGADEIQQTGSIPDPPPKDTHGALLGPILPNPFRSTARIAFSVPQHLAGVEFRLTVFDTHGRLVQCLYRGTLPPGNYDFAWNGRTDSGETCAPGIYHIELMYGDASESAKLTLLR